jgi:hypothetical protein
MNTITTQHHQHHAAPFAVAAAAAVAIAVGSVTYTVAQHSGNDTSPGNSPGQVFHGSPQPYNPGGGKMKVGP